jgi:hypothetical protein
MPYLGRRGALAPLTSADIPAGIVEGTDIAFLENSSGQTLAGTYSTERMYLSGRTGSAPNDYNYKLEGDVTVTGHLALGTIADEDVVITQDSTERTITGSGTLESGEVLSSKQTDLTGMTGELGSAVTGSPNLNLGNATFPAGHVIQLKETIVNTLTLFSCSSSEAAITGFNGSITPKVSGSKIFVDIKVMFSVDTATGTGFIVKRTGPSNATLQVGSGATYNWAVGSYFPGLDYSSVMVSMGAVVTDTAQDASTAHVYSPHFISNNATSFRLNGREANTSWCGTSSITVMEVAQ